jgi:hypothetical protein
VSEDRLDRRAARLLRCYPRSWRERYGEEFAELLVADLAEHPHSSRRTVDIVGNGLLARLSVAGLGDGPIGRPQAALATVGVAAVGFAACGLSLWSQLLVGWRTSPPNSHAAIAGVLGMSIAAGYLAAIALLAAIPILRDVLGEARARGARRLIGPLGTTITAVAVLVVGGHHFSAALPAATSHAWRSQRLVPDRLAGFGWAETLGISTYWAHPSDLLALPRTELAWMIISPAALIGAVIGAVATVRRVALAATTLRYEVKLTKAAAAGMLLFLAAAALWVVVSHRGPNGVFRAGSLDLLLIAVMAAALTIARTAALRIRPVNAP